MRVEDISAKFFVWKGWVGPVAPCLKCDKLTTGRVKDVRNGTQRPLCQDCAKKKGLT